MSKSRLKQAREIMASLDCPTDFACYRTDFKQFTQVPNVTLQELLTCKGNCCYSDPEQCKKTVKGLNRRLCSCPLRVYVANYIVNMASLVPPDHIKSTYSQLAKASCETSEDGGK